VGPLVVVFEEPGFGNLAYLLDGVEHVGIRYLIPVRLVEALDEGVLVRFSRLDELRSDATAFAPHRNGFPMHALFRLPS
jgi:hypothetical protein